MELYRAREIAKGLVEILRPACMRVEIAGSIRRRKPEVKDIEIVCVPNPIIDCVLFSENEFDRILRIIGGHRIKDGEKYKQIELPEGINLDLFIVTPPAQWGVIFTIRTGDADFSHWLVTHRRQGGALPSFLKVKDGALRNGTIIINTPEEIDFFREIGLDWIEPGKRKVK